MLRHLPRIGVISRHSILSSSPTLTIKDVADLCGLTYDGAKYHFTALKKSGKLERSGGDKCGSLVLKK